MSKWEDIFGKPLKGAFGGAGEPASGGEPSAVRRVARTTFRLFVNHRPALPWVRERDEIEASVSGALADLLRSWRVYQSGVRSRRAARRAEADWQSAAAAFRRHVSDLNRRIAAYNLKAPAPQQQAPLDPEREISRLLNER
jgi:hypothetical protein